MSPRDLDEMLPPSHPARRVLEEAGERLSLSPRGYHRTLKVARTIADLEGAEDISRNNVLEALQYRHKRED